MGQKESKNLPDDVKRKMIKSLSRKDIYNYYMLDNSVTSVILDEMADRFRNFIKYQGLKLREINNLLTEYDGIIAGGSLTQGCFFIRDDEFVTDFDFYFPEKHMKKVMEYFSDIELGDGMTCNIMTEYDDSFLKKNGILYRFGIVSKDFGRIDIMFTTRDPREVAYNFDLSFCEVYYDGRHVYAKNFEDTLSRKGKLNAEYVDSLADGNKFILNRIEKYVKRGFTINVENITFRQKIRNREIGDDRFEIWACKKFLTLNYSPYEIIDFNIKKFTYDELENTIEGFRREFIPISFLCTSGAFKDFIKRFKFPRITRQDVKEFNDLLELNVDYGNLQFLEDSVYEDRQYHEDLV